MRRISAIFILAVSLVMSGCGNNFSAGRRHKVQIAGYKTVTIDETKVYKVSHSSYASDETVVTLPSGTPVTIIDAQHVVKDLKVDMNWSDVKITIKAEYNGKAYKGWTYIRNVSFKDFALEGILEDAMNCEPYANYIAGEVDEIDQALGLRLMEEMCERAWLKRDSDTKKSLYNLACRYLLAIGEYDAGAGDTTPLHLAAKYGDSGFFRLVYAWSRNNNIPVDCPERISPDTPLIKAARNENEEAAVFLLDHGADIKRRSASGMTARDFMLASTNAALKNLAVYSRDVADYGQTLASLSAADLRDIPEGVCLNLPASVYIRSIKSGMTVETTNYDDFLNELSIREISGEVPQTEPPPVIFPFDGCIKTDDGSGLNLRDVPGLNGGIISTVSDGLPVEILGRDEHPDDIDNIMDYWYRIRAGTVEGWCFGGYLFKKLPIMDRDLRFRLGIGEQTSLVPGDTTYALSGCTMRTPSGKSIAVPASDPLEILAVCDESYVSFDDSAAYRYYLVRNADNVSGITSGRYLANERIISSGAAKLEFFLVKAEFGEGIVKTSVFMKDAAEKKCGEIHFIVNVGDGQEYDRYFFTNWQIEGIRTSSYTLRGLKLVFAEVETERCNDDYRLGWSKFFFNINGNTAHSAFSFEYNQYDSEGTEGGFADCYTGWDDDDPSSVSAIRYGRYYDECGGTPYEYSNTETYTRDENNIFSYTLTKEEHSDELPEI